MSFSRIKPELTRSAELDDAMRSIGMRIGSGRITEVAADLEVTLVSASVEAMPHDFRLLGVLVAWLEVHHAYVNVPRLKRLVADAAESTTVRAFWSSVGTWLGSKDARFRALESLYRGRRVSLDDPEITALQLERVGPDPRFDGSKLLVHAKLLRSRRADVDEPSVLVQRHPLYRMRVRLGPTYRADVWCALDAAPYASPAEIARRVGCAYETARAVAADFRLDRGIAA